MASRTCVDDFRWNGELHGSQKMKIRVMMLLCYHRWKIVRRNVMRSAMPQIMKSFFVLISPSFLSFLHSQHPFVIPFAHRFRVLWISSVIASCWEASRSTFFFAFLFLYLISYTFLNLKIDLLAIFVLNAPI